VGKKLSHRKVKGSCSSKSLYVAEVLEPRVMLAAQVVISEFMAKNKVTLKDDTGVYSDWIELHNAGDATADLSGWSLTDSKSTPQEWSFPSGATLAAGGYMVVWASGLDHRTVGQAFHTNFKLDDAGEYLALTGPDGVVVQAYAPTFPVQSSDVSYGLSDDGSAGSPSVYFSQPTPGAHNVANAAAVTFSKASGGYTSSFSLALSSATPGVQIRYTTNGSVPTASSTLYTVPFTINRDRMVRARAFGTGLNPSPVSSAQYFLLDSTTSAFHSNLPVVVLDTAGLSVGENAQTTVSAMVLDNPASGDTVLTQTPEFVGRAGLNVRGQTSAGFPKKQYHFELWDESNQDAKRPLLGMPSEADWVLYAPYSEKSLMQNELAYQWANEIGEYAVRTRWVEVFLNSSGQANVSYGRDYVGVYLLMEKIEIGPDRVNIDKVKPGEDTEPEVTGGYLWHKDKTDPGDTSSFRTVSGQTFLYEDPDASELDAAQKTWLTNYVNQFETALYGSKFTDPTEGYAKYINVRSFIDNWIMVEMAKNIDGFRLSTYYYKDRNGLITMGPVWDYNLSMGNANYGGGDTATGWYHDNIGARDYTYFDRLTQDPNFMAGIAARWKELRAGVFSTSELMADIDANVNVLTNGNGNYPVGQNPPQAPDNPVVRNFQKWRILGTYVWPNAYVGNGWLDEVNHLKDFITTRVAWMDTQLDPLVPDAAPGTPTGLGATAVSGVQINLSWALADQNATTISIERSEDEGATWVALADVPGRSTSYAVGRLTMGKSYWFRIRASNSLGTSGYSNVASATTSFQVPNLSFPTWNDTDLTFNGSSTITDGTAQLTPASGNQTGSVWSREQVDVRKFTTSFTFQFIGADGDGMTFAAQRVSNTVLGGGGGGLGYAGIGQSAAIKFDLYPSVSTTGLYGNGTAPGEDASAIDTGLNFHAGHTYTATLTYDGFTLNETIVDNEGGGTFTRTYGVNLVTTIGGGSAWVGFTASTGGAVADMRVLSWSFTSIPSDPPAAPGSLAATAVNGSEVDLAWVDASTDESDFKIYRRTGAGGAFALLATVAAGTTAYADKGLLPNQDYYYYVVASNVAGDSVASETKLAHTPLPPRVRGVYVASTSWTPSFVAALDEAGLGDFGYAIQVGPAQLDALPWTGLDQVKVQFDQDVTVGRGDLQLYGVNVATYSVAGFSYDPTTFVATWTLAAPIDDDKVLIDLSDSVSNVNGSLDGEFVNGGRDFPSGDGVAGGRFRFEFHVLPGDVNRDGSVFGNDLVLVRNAQFTTPDLAAYSVFDDIDGSGTIFGNDVVLTRNRQFHTLPAGSPSAPAPAPAPAVGAVVGAAPEVAKAVASRPVAAVRKPSAAVRKPVAAAPAPAVHAAVFSRTPVARRIG
jgi:hypothetical protein